MTKGLGARISRLQAAAPARQHRNRQVEGMPKLKNWVFWRLWRALRCFHSGGRAVEACGGRKRPKAMLSFGAGAEDGPCTGGGQAARWRRTAAPSALSPRRDPEPARPLPAAGRCPLEIARWSCGGCTAASVGVSVFPPQPVAALPACQSRGRSAAASSCPGPAWQHRHRRPGGEEAK